ncbi:MAG: lipopolysaccharide heptosyltransferase II [Candidatus Omnitrophota bacterium]|jgi:heptosyltransferase-2
MNAKKILIARTDRLGDVVLSTPVIRFMRKQFPDAYIAFMVRPESRDVVENNPDLNEVIIYDKYGSQRSFLGTVKFALSLRKKKFDLAIALHPTNRAHILLFLAGIPVRIGYDRKMGFLLTKKTLHFKHKGDKHEVDYNFDLLKHSGFDIENADRRPYMITTDNDKRLVDSVQKSFNIGGNIIAVHAGASCPSKRWPPERFAQVADELSEKYRSDIVLVGGSETEEYSKKVASAMTHKVIDLTGMLLVGELAELLSRSRIFISNDSGPVHVSAAVATPVVVIFGRKDPGLSPKRWGPLGDRDIVLHKDVGCRKCLAHICDKNFKCLEAVSAREVIEAASEILDKKRK